jgi:hypothetical protein
MQRETLKGSVVMWAGPITVYKILSFTRWSLFQGVFTETTFFRDGTKTDCRMFFPQGSAHWSSSLKQEAGEELHSLLAALG